MSSPKVEATWSTLGIRLFINVASHPFEYVKVLIQIGHEPIKPYPTTTIFGKPAYVLPNVFSYVRYIYRLEGLPGCYRGIVPRLATTTVDIFTHSKVMENIHLDEDETEPVEEEMTDAEKRNLFLRKLARDILSRSAAVIVSQPFHVVTIRTMAQFVGRETKYNCGIFSCLWTIYREEGLKGLFAGLIPRFIGELSCLIISSVVTYSFHQYVIQDKELRTFTRSSVQFVTSSLLYPFQVVSTCMTVTGSGLMAGSPPYMPLYSSWIDCWGHLSYHNQLKRGSSLLWRYHSARKLNDS